MRTVSRLFSFALLAAACGSAGCRTTSPGPVISDNRGAQAPKEDPPVANAGHSSKNPGRVVTLEPDVEDADGGSTWSKLGSKLLNPFSSPKKRIPLPLSNSVAENEGDAAVPGF